MAEGRDPTRLTVIAAVVLLCAGAVVLIVMILVGADSNDTGARALVTALTAVFFLLTATAGATLTRSRADLAWFGYLTAALSVAALAGTGFAIWGHPGEGVGKAIGIAAVLALAAAHASLLLGPRYRDGGSAGSAFCATRRWRCSRCLPGSSSTRSSPAGAASAARW